jgi:hypothetical protein
MCRVFRSGEWAANVPSAGALKDRRFFRFRINSIRKGHRSLQSERLPANSQSSGGGRAMSDKFIKTALLSVLLLAVAPGAILGQTTEKKGTTPYVTHSSSDR